MNKLRGRIIGARCKLAKRHECCGKVYVGNVSWKMHRRRHRLKLEKAIPNGDRTKEQNH